MNSEQKEITAFSNAAAPKTPALCQHFHAHGSSRSDRTEGNYFLLLFLFTILFLSFLFTAHCSLLTVNCFFCSLFTLHSSLVFQMFEQAHSHLPHVFDAFFHCGATIGVAEFFCRNLLSVEFGYRSQCNVEKIWEFFCLSIPIFP